MTRIRRDDSASLLARRRWYPRAGSLAMMSVDASGFGSGPAYTPPVAPPPPGPAPEPQERPEILVGAAFLGGVALALLLKRAGRVT